MRHADPEAREESRLGRFISGSVLQDVMSLMVRLGFDVIRDPPKLRFGMRRPLIV